MSNCNARTDSRGHALRGPISIHDLHTLTLGECCREEKQIPDLSYEPALIGDLLSISKSNNLNTLIEYLMRELHLLATSPVKYCQHRNHFYIQVKRKIYTCQSQRVYEVQAKPVIKSDEDEND